MLRPDEPENDKECYRWEPRSQVCGQINNKYEVKVCPTETTTFLCYKGCDQTNATLIKSVKVYVITGIQISKINNETIGNQSPLPEFMDEYSELQVEGNIIGKDAVEITIEDEIVNINFQSSLANIQYNSTPMYSLKNGQFKSQAIKIISILSDDKQYTLNIKAGIGNLCPDLFSSIDVTIKRLWIDEFKHPLSNDEEHNNVVLMDNVVGKAFCTNSCTDFKWEMLYAGMFKLKNNFGQNPINTQMELSTLSEDNTTMPKFNGDFGEKFGVVILSCIDTKTGRRLFVANKHDKMIESDSRFKGENVRISKGIVRVFFHKDDLIPEDKGNEPRNPSIIPNWMYYWRQIFESKYPNISLIKFSEDNKQRASTGRPSNIHAHHGREILQTSVFSQRVSEIGDVREKGGNKIGEVTGIFSFYKSLNHENFHASFIRNMWPSPDFYNKNLDNECGIGDWYKNSWELSDPDIVGYNFHPQFDDGYSTIPGGFCRNMSNPVLTAGFSFEEDYGMEAEKEAFLDEKYKFETLLPNDWSYDRTNRFQGKQWK